MNYEEAKAVLQSYKDNPLVNNKEAFEIAIQALEQRWIPVSERLPDVHKEVLLTICDNSALQGFNENFVSVRCGKYQPHEYRMNWVVDGVYYHFDNVIAWQPKPEPYKIESEE